MATTLQYTSDASGGIELTKGSNGRLNVSSRADSRAYYNSRDVGQTYAGVFEMTAASEGEFVAYLQNTSTTGKTLVVNEITMGSALDSIAKLWFVSGTPVDGTPSSATNLNRASPNAATGIALEGGSAATGITGLVKEAIIGVDYIKAGSSNKFNLGDTLRLGQNDAIAIEKVTGSDGDVSGSIVVYFE